MAHLECAGRAERRRRFGSTVEETSRSIQSGVALTLATALQILSPAKAGSGWCSEEPMNRGRSVNQPAPSPVSYAPLAKGLQAILRTREFPG